jgi:hypothetical protein
MTKGSMPKSRPAAARSASIIAWNDRGFEYHSAPPCHMKTTGRPFTFSRYLSGTVAKKRFHCWS